MPEEKMVETTVEQFERFKESVNFYVDLLHLGEWKVFFYHSDNFDNEPLGDCFALVHANFPGRVVDFVMSKTLPDYCYERFDPWLHGKHEVCELLLRELGRSCDAHYNAQEVEGWTHAVIRRLERALPDE